MELPQSILLTQMVKDLQLTKLITEYQAKHISRDLQDQNKLKTIEKTLYQSSIKDILKLYIKANYYDNDTEHERKIHQKQSFQITQKQSLEQKINEFSNNRIIKQFTKFFSSFKNKYNVVVRFLSQMICHQNRKTSESYVIKLLQLLMNTKIFSFIKYTEPSPKPKIQFFDSFLNYLTIYLQDEAKFKQIQQTSSQIQQGIYDNSNIYLQKLFSSSPQSNNIFLVKNNFEGRIIFKMQVQSPSFYRIIRESQQLQQIFSIFVNQIIKTLHRCKFQTSKYILQRFSMQHTVKQMIDILELSLKINSILGEKQILSVIQQEINIKYKSIQEYVDQQKKIISDHGALTFIEEISQNFCKNISKFQSRINVYKSQLSDNSIVFMDFDKFGVLNFLSNRFPSIHFNRLRMNLFRNYQTIKIQDIFRQGSQVLKHFGHALNGLVITEPLFFHDDGYPGEIAFAYNQNNQLVRTHIHIFLRESKRYEGSLRNFLSAKSIVSSDSEKDINKIIKQSTGINNEAKKRLIDIKELETPGVTKFGWLQLFVKHDVIDKHKRKRSNPSVCLNEQQINTFSQIINASILHSSSSLYCVSQEVVDSLNIQDYDLNLLEVDPSLYVPFIEKVFKNLSYFSQSDIDGLKFQNFILEIQQKYSKHNNPFHNMIHGMNVMHQCYLFSKLQKTTNYLSQLQRFILVLSGLCHDTGHRGFNNNFQIATLSKKAIRWNDKSPLESYHASTTFKILLRQQNNFLSNVKKETFLYIRKLMIANILATDIKQHFPILANFQNNLKSLSEFEKSPANIELLSTFLIHTSDFVGASKSFQISQQWSRRCNKEFSNQYKQEARLGIPQTVFMKDLDNEIVLSKNQSGFLKVIVRPLYKSMNDFYQQQCIKKMLNNIDDTILIWEKASRIQNSNTKEKEEPNNRKDDKKDSKISSSETMDQKKNSSKQKLQLQ